MKAIFDLTPAGTKPLSSLASARPAGDVVAVVMRVKNPDGACEQARKYDGKTFAVATAPRLPLADCGRIDCKCRYERVTDRRMAERRVHADRREAFRFEMKDDRRKVERRKGKSAWRGSGV